MLWFFRPRIGTSSAVAYQATGPKTTISARDRNDGIKAKDRNDLIPTKNKSLKLKVR